MNAIRIRKKLDSETLYLPELRSLLGKTVEITVREESTDNGQAWVNPLRGSVLRDDDPFEPAVASEDWEANR